MLKYEHRHLSRNQDHQEQTRVYHPRTCRNQNPPKTTDWPREVWVRKATLDQNGGSLRISRLLMHRIRASFLIFVRFNLSHRARPDTRSGQKLYQTDLRGPRLSKVVRYHSLWSKARKHPSQWKSEHSQADWFRQRSIQRSPSVHLYLIKILSGSRSIAWMLSQPWLNERYQVS